MRMYSENLINDCIRIGKAIATNQIAWIWPALYMRITHETGRGIAEEAAGDVAGYCIRCFKDYDAQLCDLLKEKEKSPLKGKTVLEYGPGDMLGVALLIYAHGAKAVHCVDRFPLNACSEKALQVYRAILGSLGNEARARANAAFVKNGEPESGFRSDAIQYRVTPDGLSCAECEYDLILSRAVLEHVEMPEKTIMDIRKALKPGGITLHNVDLKSHGLDRYKALDFLTFPDWLYSAMYSHKGYPNRHRMGKYLEDIITAEMHIRRISVTESILHEQIDEIRPFLAKRFRNLDDEQLVPLGFWMAMEHGASDKKRLVD
jgi:hypothetical protein